MSTSTITKPIDLNAPGALDDLFKFHRSTFGDTRMEGPETPPAVETVTVPVPTPPAFDASNPQVAALIEQARKQEKDKLYGEIETLRSRVGEFDTLQQTVNTLQADRERDLAAARETAAAEAAEAARKQWEEQDAKTLLAEKDREWEARFQQMQADAAAERESLAKEAAFAQFQNQTQALVQKALDDNAIAPELAHLVTGNNVEEVQASLESVRLASEAIAANVTAAMQNQPPAPRGVSPTGYAPVGPMEMQQQTRTLSAEDIRNMPMSEWAKMRQSMPGVNQQSQTNRGLFG